MSSFTVQTQQIQAAAQQLLAEGGILGSLGGSIAQVGGVAAAVGHGELAGALRSFTGDWGAGVAQLGYQVSITGYAAQNGHDIYDQVETGNSRVVGDH